MNRMTLGTALLAALTLAACTDTATTPPDTPPSTTMTYRQGARYQYESYQTEPATDARRDTSARRRTWTLVNTNASVEGRTGVAVYVDSLFTTAGGFVNVTDSVLIHQQSGTNDVYRFSSLITEANEVSIVSEVPFLGGLDFGSKWQQEARLNSTTGIWRGNELSDTVPNTFNIPLITGFKLAIVDSAVASSVENVTIGGATYAATKSTHHLHLSVTALFGTTFPPPIEVASSTILRTVWVVPALGTIVKEHREGKVIQVNYQGQGFTIPIPGYHAELTSVLSAGI
ncbi:MAG TPA: hypothetical protein VNA88_09160 [Candidatus Kapabacteria bacterium]|nr:hypothetical protein [Candidatus Kapabacteria bacterium]